MKFLNSKIYRETKSRYNYTKTKSTIRMKGFDYNKQSKTEIDNYQKQSTKKNLCT